MAENTDGERGFVPVNYLECSSSSASRLHQLIAELSQGAGLNEAELVVEKFQKGESIELGAVEAMVETGRVSVRFNKTGNVVQTILSKLFFKSLKFGNALFLIQVEKYSTWREEKVSSMLQRDQ